MGIWHDPYLAATLFGLGLTSVWERKTLTGVHIWDDPNLAQFGLSMGKENADTCPRSRCDSIAVLSDVSCFNHSH